MYVSAIGSDIQESVVWGILLCTQTIQAMSKNFAVLPAKSYINEKVHTWIYNKKEWNNHIDYSHDHQMKSDCFNNY